MSKVLLTATAVALAVGAPGIVAPQTAKKLTPPPTLRGEVMKVERTTVVEVAPDARVAQPVRLGDLAKKAILQVVVKGTDGKASAYEASELVAATLKVGDKVECQLSSDRRTLKKCEVKVGAPTSVARREQAFVIKDIAPIETDIEVEGAFTISADGVEGTAKVLKGGSFVKRTPFTGETSADTQMMFVPGGLQISLREGAEVTPNYSLWLPGLTHVLKGVLKDLGRKGFLFESGVDSPLTFRLVRGVGYVYVKGSGTVTTPDGTVRLLP